VHRVAVIFNPATSPDDAPERKRDLQAALNAAGIEVVWLETTEQEAGQGLTRQAVEQGVDLVLASRMARVPLPPAARFSRCRSGPAGTRADRRSRARPCGRPDPIAAILDR
jgi:hypothetical protein